MTSLRTSVVIALALPLVAAPAWLGATPVTYQVPAETAELKPGPNLDVARNNCTSCHSADYIKTQPPQAAERRRDFWQAEVTKMIKVYGAPIEDADVAKIVDYLSQTY